MPLMVIVALLTSGLTIGLDPSPVRADTHAKVTTTVSEVSNRRFANGEPGGLGYKVTYDVTDEVQPLEWLPTARVDAIEHPAAFDGQWADAGFQAAWVSPKGRYQFQPDAFTVESGYLDSYINHDGINLQAGDSADMAVAQLSLDAPLTWDRERGAATGEMEWEVASQVNTVRASYGGAEGEMEVIFARADLVARGGDFDARDASVQLPPLVIDLPKSYGPGVVGSATTAQFAPYLSYITGLEGQVVPQAGKAVFTARTRGYIPEAREYTLPGGAHIREWHIPLNIVISLTRPTDPTGLGILTNLRSGGLVKSHSALGTDSVAVLAGSSVIGAPGLPLEVLSGSGSRSADAQAGSEEQAPPPAASGGGTFLDDMKAAAPIDRTLSQPAALSLGKRSYSFAVDPDLHGSGALGIRTFDHARTGQRFFRLNAVPSVTLNGETIPLERSRLVDLRVVPVQDFIRLGFSGRNDGTAFDQTSTVRARYGRVFRPGVSLEAVYSLGGDRFAFVTAWAMQEAGGNGDGVYTMVEVRSLTDAPARVSALNYMELDPGPLTYNGELQESEFTGPSGVLQTLSGRVFSGATGGGRIVVVRANGIATEFPTSDSGVALTGAPMGLYLTSTNGSTSGYYVGALQSILDDVAAKSSVGPSPIAEPCIDPPIMDATGDADPGFDIERSWFEFDGEELHTTIQVARLDESTLASPASFRTSWRFEHVGYGVRAARDVTGAWTYNLGLHPSSGASWSRIYTATGEIQYGAPGYIRMSHPVDVQLTGTGFLDGELFRDTGAVSYDANGVVDRAEAGAPELAYGKGGDYLIALCPGSTVGTTLELLDASSSSGQYGDAVTLSARLTDAAGDPVSGERVDFELGDLGGMASTDGQGVASFTSALDLRPGEYALDVSFAGTEVLEPSSVTKSFTVEREDSGLELTVEGKGSKRTLSASLFDLDDRGRGVAGRTIEFFADGAPIGSALTQNNGTASFEAPPRYRGGSHGFEAIFEGDAFYLPSSATTRT
jgi:hypothetical protein